MTIGVMFTGLKRFVNTTKANHQQVLDILDQRFGIEIYNYFRDSADPACPFDQSGKVQVYDFLTGKDKVKQQVFVKIRSDVYFTGSSIDVLCKEIDAVLSHESDIVYMGIDFMNDYSAVHKREDARTVHGHKVTDFVIVARKDKVADTDTIINLMKNNVKDKSGNKTFNLIMTDSAVAKKVSCQMYLVRKDYSTYDNWQIYHDWCMQYQKSEQAQNWVENNQDLIRTF
jgi:hypothetical protein